MKMGSITLLPKQQEAVEKFKDVDGILVGFDTGTGKTVAGVALVQQLWDRGETGPVLLITKSFDVWLKHFKLMDIDLDRVHVIDKRKRAGFIEDLEKISRNPYQTHFYMMHWDALPLADMLPVLKRIKWLCILADEGHKAKNRKAQRTKAIKQLKTKVKIALTATPGDNATPDVWSLLNWLYPKRYTSYWRWVNHYVECEKTWQGYTLYHGPIEERIPEFQAEIEPFYLFCAMEEVDPDVPPFVYSTTEVVMSDKQAQAYADIARMQMAYLGDDLLIAGIQVEANMRQHQLANSFGRVEIGKKWKWITEKGKKKKIQVDTQIVRLEEPSTKLNRLMEILEGKPFECYFDDDPDNLTWEQISPDEPVVVFSTYRDMVTMACSRMSAMDISYVSLMGGPGGGDMDVVAKAFQDGKARVFIGTAEAAGESIELTRARITIYIDVHWSPRVKQQCDGRTRRIGQRKQPWAIHIKTRNTVDFAKLDRVQTKEAWLDAMFGRNRQ